MVHEETYSDAQQEKPGSEPADATSVDPHAESIDDAVDHDDDRGPATVGKDLIEEEKLATSEGMPAGETDVSPKAAIAGE
jgi:hypothetical protein